ncbi:aldehyde ferredoxin oxidoreductase family protein [Desulfocicer niacini]
MSIYFGTILYIDLTTGIIKTTPFPEKNFYGFLTGRGFNVHHLYHHLPKGIDALDAENILIFSCGMLTGTSAPTGARLHINALSPMTGMLGSSNIGGSAGAWLRSCGIMSLIITGKSKAPVWLHINENTAELRDAASLWGLDAMETQERLATEKGKQPKMFTIGTAGENGCRFANIISGNDHAAGRTGMGAVMGAKNLKVIGIEKGHRKLQNPNAEAFRRANKAYVDALKATSNFDIFSRLGGAGYVNWANDKGIISAYNYRDSTFQEMDQLDGKHLVEDVVKKRGCFGCPVQCKAQLVLSKGNHKGETAHRPEFEPMINLGSKCGLKEIDAVVHLDNLCTRLGMDSTSAATTIAFAMDLFERGILTKNDTDGLDLTWGNASAMESIIRQMARNQGPLGTLLSQGVMRAAQIIGKGSEKFAAHVKGLELTAYNPGAIMGSALGYAISSRGGDYNNVYASLEYGWPPEKAMEAFGTADAVDITLPGGKGALVKRAVLVNIMVDCLGLCKVPVLSLLGTFNLEYEASLVSGLIGETITPETLFSAAARVAALERKFNLRHAPEKAEDTLPEMFFNTEKSILSEKTVQGMVQDFYSAMGWDSNGVPPDDLE